MGRKGVNKCEPIIALGAMTFGGQTSAADAGRMLDMFLAEGHTWVDTAHMYTEGRSEAILGRLLKGARRRKVFLATKIYPGTSGAREAGGLRPAVVRRRLETSLRRLKTDCVDLLYLHAPDNRTPLEATLGACRELIQVGKVRETGLSNYAAWQIAEAVMICVQNGWTPPIIYQGMYNALTRDVERECLVACRHFGLDFIAYNPLAGGLLSGKYGDVLALPKGGRFAGRSYRDRYWRDAYFEAVGLMTTASRRARIPLAEASLRWLKHHSRTDGILLGASRIEHLEQNLAACRKGLLSPSLCEAFDRAWEIARTDCQCYFRD